MSDLTAKDIIAKLNMQPHPEGGWYAETFRDTETQGDRANSTAIYYLLEKDDRSHWHRVDAVEIWHFYAGAPLTLEISDEKTTVKHILGTNLAQDQKPQVIVPKSYWQAAKSTGAYTLVGCTVAPGFQFEGFELAPNNWSPSKKK